MLTKTFNCRHCGELIIPCVRCRIVGPESENYIADWCHEGALGYHHCGPDGIRAEPDYRIAETEKP